MKNEDQSQQQCWPHNISVIIMNLEIRFLETAFFSNDVLLLCVLFCIQKSDHYNIDRYYYYYWIEYKEENDRNIINTFLVYVERQFFSLLRLREETFAWFLCFYLIQHIQSQS